MTLHRTMLSLISRCDCRRLSRYSCRQLDSPLVNSYCIVNCRNRQVMVDVSLYGLPRQHQEHAQLILRPRHRDLERICRSCGEKTERTRARRACPFERKSAGYDTHDRQYGFSRQPSVREDPAGRIATSFNAALGSTVWIPRRLRRRSAPAAASANGRTPVRLRRTERTMHRSLQRMRCGRNGSAGKTR